jgi:iron complex transport system substrate-binding protein
VIPRPLLAGVAAAITLLALGCQRDEGVSAAPSAAASSSRAAVPADARIVSVGGTVTEIVFALGLGPRVVAVDTSSVFPVDATALPQVGYQRTLAAEGVASQRPTLLLLTHEAGPPPAVEQLRGLGIPLHVIPADASVEGAKEKIRLVAAALGEKAKGEELTRTLTAELASAEALTKSAKSKPKVLFIYARGGGTLMVGGTGTPASVMIQLAAGENAVSAFDGFKPLTAEAVTTAAPDVILVPSRGLETLGGIDGLVAQPGIALTPAGKARRVVAMDDLLLLGFGPRLGSAVRALAILLHPELGQASP